MSAATVVSVVASFDWCIRLIISAGKWFIRFNVVDSVTQLAVQFGSKYCMKTLFGDISFTFLSNKTDQNSGLYAQQSDLLGSNCNVEITKVYCQPR